MLTDSIQKRINLRANRNVAIEIELKKLKGEYDRNVTEIKNLYKKAGVKNVDFKPECMYYGDI
jgi:hypothetical protein